MNRGRRDMGAPSSIESECIRFDAPPSTPNAVGLRTAPPPLPTPPTPPVTAAISCECAEASSREKDSYRCRRSSADASSMLDMPEANDSPRRRRSASEPSSSDMANESLRARPPRLESAEEPPALLLMLLMLALALRPVPLPLAPAPRLPSGSNAIASESVRIRALRSTGSSNCASDSVTLRGRLSTLAGVGIAAGGA